MFEKLTEILKWLELLLENWLWSLVGMRRLEMITKNHLCQSSQTLESVLCVANQELITFVMLVLYLLNTQRRLKAWTSETGDTNMVWSQL